MKIMTDKEVGELWRSRGVLERTARHAVKQLIFKLVEERRMSKGIDETEALRTFGIDPEDYPQEDTSYIVRGAYNFARRVQGKKPDPK